jgi:hypothetical protein
MDVLDTNERRDANVTAATARLGRGVETDLIAVLVAVTAGEPRVLTIQDSHGLPSGPFEMAHRSLQMGLRGWVERQTHHPLGYVEQLYTFADRDRTGDGTPAISISYLGLTHEHPASGDYEASWQSWYTYFPWEDHRIGRAAIVDTIILPKLEAWSLAKQDPAVQLSRRNRIAITFGGAGQKWNEELVLQRYELLYEAGLIQEASHAATPAIPGQSMLLDHRRILATGIARLRAKIKYNPVVFELMPETFTLLQLQRCVEALAGRLVHKQNFRRLIEQQELVEETGALSQETGGRPAKLFRFRRDVLAERAVVGTKLPLSRT